MNKQVLYGILIAAVGYIVYRYVSGPQSGAWSVSPYSDPNFSTQPAQQYPYQPNIPPRVDNSNQPWYGGSREGIVANGPSDIQKAADFTSGINDILKSTQSLWEDLGVSSWFQDEDPMEAFSQEWMV